MTLLKVFQLKLHCICEVQMFVKRECLSGLSWPVVICVLRLPVRMWDLQDSVLPSAPELAMYCGNKEYVKITNIPIFLLILNFQVEVLTLLLFSSFSLVRKYFLVETQVSNCSPSCFVPIVLHYGLVAPCSTTWGSGLSSCSCSGRTSLTAGGTRWELNWHVFSGVAVVGPTSH